MQPSKMQLENYFVEEVSFDLQDEQIQSLEDIPKLDSTDLDIEVKLGVSEDDEHKKFCQLTVSLKKEIAVGFPYKFRIQFAGFFKLASSCTEEETAILMTNAAPSMLYTAAREYLLLITGRTRFLPIMLPTVLFAPKQKAISKVMPKTKNSVGKKAGGSTTKPKKKLAQK